MERKIEIWNGAPEYEGICRKTSPAVKEFIESESSRADIRNYSGQIVATMLKADDGFVCIPASSEEFKEFGAIRFDDIGVILRYTETLINRCEKWKP